MNIARVQEEAHYWMIPLRGWEDVTAALSAFAHELPQQALDIPSHPRRAILDAFDAEDLPLFAGTSQRVEWLQLFLEMELRKARAALENQTRWQGGYEYEGIGPFFKTAVDIVHLDRAQELYGLGLKSSGIGDQPERELADFLQVERCLYWCKVTIETSPEGNLFFFDFDQLLERLRGVHAAFHLSGEQLASELMAATDFGPGVQGPCALLFREGRLWIKLAPERVARRYDKRGDRLQWKREEGVLTGPLEEIWDRPGAYRPPTIAIELFDGFQRPPLPGYEAYASLAEMRYIWEAPLKQRILETTRRIVEALRGL